MVEVRAIKTMISAPTLNAPWFYIGVPVIVFVAPYVLAAFGYPVESETGFIERLTVAVLVLAVITLFMTLPRALRVQKRLFAWVVLLALGSIYFAGEELSWGQWVFGWQTSSDWASINDQQETNLHNLEGWGFLLDQLPRLLLTLAAVVAVIVPAYRRATSTASPPVTTLSGLLPTGVCVPAALLAVLIRPIDTIAEMAVNMGILPTFFAVGGGELKECMLAVFIFIYAAALRNAVEQEAHQ